MKGVMKSITAAAFAFAALAATPVAQTPAQAFGTGLAGAETKSEAVTQVHSRRRHHHRHHNNYAYRYYPNYSDYGYYRPRYYSYGYRPYAYRPYGYGYGYSSYGGYGHGWGRRGGFSLRIGGW